MTVQRVEWTCPGCRKRFAIPAQMAEPEFCPACRSSKAAVVAAPPPVPKVREEQLTVDAAEEATEATLPDFDLFDAEHGHKRHVHRPRAKASRQRSTSYPALRILVICFRVLAGLVAVSALWGFYDLIRGVTSAKESSLRGVLIDAGLHWFALKLIGIVVLIAIGELILLLLDIESNTRQRATGENTDGERDA